jgi:hypothetical protein
MLFWIGQIGFQIAFKSIENMPGQCVLKQAAPTKTFGYSQMAYIELGKSRKALLRQLLKALRINDRV